MRLSLIAAMAKNRVIGSQGDIPWRIPGEQRIFKKITLGHAVIMGRKTFESLEQLQSALDRYLVYYNNYRLHSGLGWQTPASRYTGCAISVTGLAQIPGLEPMAAHPTYAPSPVDPPIPITPLTATKFRAIVPVENC